MTPESQSFLSAAKQGRNQWWRYLCGIVLIILGFVGLGSVLVIVVAIAYLAIAYMTSGNTGMPPTSTEIGQRLEQLLVTPSVPAFILSMLPFVCFFGSIVLVVPLLHQRPIRSLISASGPIRWRRMAAGFGVWFLLMAALSGVGYLQSPQSYTASVNLEQWLLLLPVALILVPIQTSAEELFFRGYLLQGMGLLTRQPLVLILLNSILFTLPHLGNPEMARGAVWGALIYWLWGVFFTVITLRDNRMELALGAHAANNLFITLFLNTSDSALPSPSLWTATEPADAQGGFLWLLILTSIFYGVFFWRQQRPTVG